MPTNVLGYSAKETLNIMQRLYESHKVLTYPRTDSRYITTDVADTLKERLKACSVGPYRKLAGSLSMRPIRKNASFVDNKKGDRSSCNHSDRTVCGSAGNDERRA